MIKVQRKKGKNWKKLEKSILIELFTGSLNIPLNRAQPNNSRKLNVEY